MCMGRPLCARPLCVLALCVLGPGLCVFGINLVASFAAVRPLDCFLSLAVRYTGSLRLNVVSGGVSTLIRALNNMSTNNVDTHTLSTAEYTDPLVPLHSDKTPINWDGNYAHIEGLLHEVGRYYKRTGRFQLLLKVKHRAVALSNGRIAVESFEAVWFTSGKVSDKLKDATKKAHDFDEPCPPTKQRFDNAVADYTAHGVAPPTPLAKMPAEQSAYTVQSEAHVEAEDAKLLKSLAHAFGQSENSEDLIDEADGSGYNFLTILRKKAGEATPTDRALVSAEHAKIVRDGVTGFLSLATLKAFDKRYKAATRNLPPTSRPPDAAVAEMYSLIGLKDPSTRLGIGVGDGSGWCRP